MDVINLDLPNQAEKPRPFTYWVRRFHNYSAQATNKQERMQAMADLWQDWTAQEHKFRYSIGNAIELFLAVNNYRPDRTPSNGSAIASNGTQLVRWNDSPIYDTWTSYRAGLTPWTCIDWVNYHKALKNHHGDQAKANMIWETDWADPDNECGILICPDTSYCRYNCNFVEYFASQGIRIGNIVSNAACDISDVVANTTGAIKDVSDGIKATSSIFALAIPAVAVIWVGSKIYNN